MCDVCVTRVVRVKWGGGGGMEPGRKENPQRSYHTVPNFHNAYKFGSEASRKHSTDR